MAEDPVDLRGSRPPPRRARFRGLACGAPARDRVPRGGDLGNRHRGVAGAAVGVRVLARGGPGCAHGLRLRAPRRPAGGTAQRVGLPAVRAGRGGRCAVRPWRIRRQGPGAAAHARAACLPGRGRGDRAPGQPEAAGRRRGGVGLAALRRAAARQGRPARLRCHRGLRHHDVGGRRAVPVHRDARARGRGGHAARARDRPALGLVRRWRAQPVARDGRAARGPARRQRPGHAPRVLRQGGQPDPEGAGAVRAAAPSRIRRRSLAT